MIDHINRTLKDLSMEELGLNVRAYNALRRAGLITVFDVCRSINDDTVWKVKNIGVKSVDEIIQKTEQFLATQELTLPTIGQPNKKNLQQVENENGSENVTLPNIKTISDLNLDTLNNYLGHETVAALGEIGIIKIQEFQELVGRYLTFINPNGHLVAKTLNELTYQVNALIEQGRLSPNCLVESTTLAEFLDWMPRSEGESNDKLQLFKRILKEKSLSDEINRVISELSDRQKEIFLAYSLFDLTLEEVGTQQNVTRERIRQILSEATTKLRRGLDSSLKVFISTSFEIAKELDRALSKDIWKQNLIERRILTDDKQEIASFEFFTALLKNKNTSQSIFGIPESVNRILKLNSPHSIFVMDAMQEIDKAEIREVKRVIKFTGGINIEHASQLLGFNTVETESILNAIGINEIVPGWYASSGEKELNKNTPILRGGLILIQCCGPLSVESFCDGLRRYITRHYEALAPIEVVINVLQNYGFKVENNLVSYKGNEKADVSVSDQLFLELLLEKGKVVSFQEIVNFYLANGKSFPTATVRVMGESPVVEKIEQGLYKLRGSKVSWQDVELAKSRQEEFTRNAEVSYGLDGIICYRLTLGPWGAGGVLSISRSGQPLPDFPDGWPVYVNNEEIGLARRDGYNIWGLSPALNKLGANLGDRVELAFDTWNEPRINIRLVEEING